MTKLEIKQLSRHFGETVAVDNISMTIEDGEFLVLLGPSGCGKSTLLRMLAGLLPSTSGSVLLDDEDVTHKSARQRDLAMVFQSYALYPHLSVAKNLAFPLRARGMPRDEVQVRVREAAERLDIAHLLARRPKELSGGQRQRVAVGRALVRDPRAYLMDEPLSNLDAKLRLATRHELVKLHRRMKATFVYVTHDQVEAMTMATRIAVLNEGRVEQIGTPDEIYNTPETVFVAGFIGGPPMNLLDAVVTSTQGTVRVEGGCFTGSLRDGNQPHHNIKIGVRPEHLHIGQAPHGRHAVSFNTTVESIERLGHESVVFASVEQQTIAFRTTPDVTLSPGDSLVLHAISDNCHLFDAETGIRMQWQEQPNSSVKPQLANSL